MGIKPETLDRTFSCIRDGAEHLYHVKPSGLLRTNFLGKVKLPELKSDVFKKCEQLAQGSLECAASSASKLPEAFKSIEFVPAKTIDEATIYAQNVLGLEAVDYQNRLDIANWSNEAFTSLVNKFEGKKYIPLSFSVRPYEVIGGEVKPHTFAFQNNANIIVFSKAIENDGIKGLEKLSKSWPLDSSNQGGRNFLYSLYPKEVIQKIDDILTKCKATEKIDFKSMLITYDFEKEFDRTLSEFKNNPNDMFMKIFDSLSEKDMYKLTKDGSVYTGILKENYGKTPEEIQKASQIFTEQINRIMSNKTAKWDDNIDFLKIMGDVLGEKQTFLTTIDKFEKMPMSFDTIFHECGHLAHEKYRPQKSYEIMRYYNSYKSYFSDYRPKVKRLVSDRGAANAEEYIAEHFRLKARGIRINDPDLDELNKTLEVT